MGATKNLITALLLCVVSTEVLSQNEVEDDLNKLSRANAYFAHKMYRQVSNSNTTNFVFSPLSISVALSMLNEGAIGTTFQEINSTLGFLFAQLNEQELLQGYQSLVTSLTTNREGYEYSLANAQFVHNAFPIYENYTRIMVEDFHAEDHPVDFRNQAETLRVINGWVRDQTRGKIQSILQELDPLSVMALVNAVYFKGEWATKFDENLTRDTDFFSADGTRKLVKMMSEFTSAKCNLDHELGGSVLELPYKGNFFSMIFILPSRRSNLSNLEERLSPEALLRITDDLHTMNLTVGVPKMKFESSFDLVDNLKSVGINKVFTDFAELDRISPADLKVGQAVHKATLEINEEGSEASAATAVVTVTRNGGHRSHFWLNRPFTFLLRHNPSNTICFMGRVVDV